MPDQGEARTPVLVFITPKADGVDVSSAHFPLIVKYGDREYLLVKSQFEKLMLNRKD